MRPDIRKFTILFLVALGLGFEAKANGFRNLLKGQCQTSLEVASNGRVTITTEPTANPDFLRSLNREDREAFNAAVASYKDKRIPLPHFIAEIPSVLGPIRDLSETSWPNQLAKYSGYLLKPNLISSMVWSLKIAETANEEGHSGTFDNRMLGVSFYFKRLRTVKSLGWESNALTFSKGDHRYLFHPIIETDLPSIRVARNTILAFLLNREMNLAVVLPSWSGDVNYFNRGVISEMQFPLGPRWSDIDSGQAADIQGFSFLIGETNLGPGSLLGDQMGFFEYSFFLGISPTFYSGDAGRKNLPESYSEPFAKQVERLVSPLSLKESISYGISELLEGYLTAEERAWVYFRAQMMFEDIKLNPHKVLKSKAKVNSRF